MLIFPYLAFFLDFSRGGGGGGGNLQICKFANLYCYATFLLVGAKILERGRSLSGEGDGLKEGASCLSYGRKLPYW